MQKITSLNNKLVLDIKLLHQKKFRDKNNLFLAEGQKVLDEAIKSRLKIKYIFGTDESILKNYTDENTFLVTEQIIKKLATTETAPDIICVAEKPVHNIRNIKKGPLILLEGIQDPGNLGTIIRTSSAFAISAILLIGDTVDIYNPKVIRSTVGNLWKLPIIKITPETLKKEFKNFKLIATTLDKTKHPKAFYEIKSYENSIVMFGSEATGLSEDMINKSDEFIHIPMQNNVESLNLSVSAGIIIQYIYEKRALK